MNKEEFETLYSILYEYVKNNVKEKRFEHILGVVKASEKYAIKYGADIYKAKIAAIFHDACKDNNPGLEHGVAAARLLKEKFNVNDDEILLAIENHTIGRKNPCILEKVIKLSDLLEEGRTYDDVPEIRKYDDKINDIDKTYLLLLERQREVLIKKGIDYDKRTDDVIAWFKQEIDKNDK